jgi:hypothetical protein
VEAEVAEVAEVAEAWANKIPLGGE